MPSPCPVSMCGAEAAAVLDRSSPPRHHPGHTAGHTPAAWPRCPACCARHPCRTGQNLHESNKNISSSGCGIYARPPISAMLWLLSVAMPTPAWTLPSPGSCLTAVALISASGSRASCWTRGSRVSTTSGYWAVGHFAAAAIPCNAMNVDVSTHVDLVGVAAGM